MLNSSDGGSSGARSCALNEGDVEARPMNDRNRFVVEDFFFVVSVVDRFSCASPEYVLTNTGCAMEVEDDWPPECSCCCCC